MPAFWQSSRTTGLGRADGERVALPVREADDAESEREAEEQTAAPAEDPAEDDQQSTDAGEQHRGLRVVLHGAINGTAGTCGSPVSRL
jgi:hypothetical protein